MRLTSIVAILIVVGFQIGADKPKKEKPLTKQEKEAIAKYDDLPDEFKEKAVAYWKDLHAKTKDPRVMKNNPRLIPDLVDRNMKGDNIPLTKERWGKFDRQGIGVFQVIDKRKAICQSGKVLFLLEGVDTSGMTDDSGIKPDGIFYVDGNYTYKSLDGGSNTIMIVKPVPKKEPEKSD